MSYNIPSMRMIALKVVLGSQIWAMTCVSFFKVGEETDFAQPETGGPTLGGSPVGILAADTPNSDAESNVSGPTFVMRGGPAAPRRHARGAAAAAPERGASGAREAPQQRTRERRPSGGPQRWPGGARAGQ